jgi:hypothetical protein
VDNLSKFVQTDYLNKKEILKFPDHYVALAVMVDDSGVSANADGKKIVPAGTIVGGKDAPVLENLDQPVVNKNTPPAKATKNFAVAQDNDSKDINLTLTAVEPGAAGNSISLTMSSSSAATGEEVEVVVSNTDITVKPVVADNAVTSTIGDVVNAINADADAKALVVASADEDVLDKVITKNVAKTTLAGGSDGTVTDAEGILLNDVDVTYGPAPGAMLIHGFVAVDKLPEVPAFGAAAALPMIAFIK